MNSEEAVNCDSMKQTVPNRYVFQISCIASFIDDYSTGGEILYYENGTSPLYRYTYMVSTKFV